MREPFANWTHRMNSECVMMGVPTYAFYSQVWYDWDRGMQISVFVRPDNSGAYAERMDQWLPKGKPGPTLFYSWDGSKWIPACHVQPPDAVAMPVPDFVKSGGGICRATIEHNSYFGTISIWSAALPEYNGHRAADFWFWFNERSQGVIFSLAPAHSLTIIDYQTFVQRQNRGLHI
jgi:hypothetical protein